ncbi:Exportin-1/Importin-beta-like [Macleaya cordata]|uniref:Exportin-T n=1 Tax=Macleaya cordata TaxID=56857 RepID=A0A200QCZ4_MACCD|nr:Exportin-1/Importin-beta-like [Macleaya cordata]
MDDLEKAILISFDESGTIDPGLKSQAVAYCQQMKETPSVCRLCIERFSYTKFVQVQFWCLQTLHEVLRLRYSSVNPEEKSFIRNSVLSMACSDGGDDKNSVRVLDGPAFIKNKFAQVFVTLIYFEYPMIWSSVFVDFLPHLSKGSKVIDMFCRVLNALDDELISLDYPRSAEEVAIAARVKDAMRQQCVAQIVRAWYDIISLYRNSDPELCTGILDSMRRYISWIDIGLIANDAFVPLLFDLILVEGLPDQLRGAAAGCVLAIVSKRMDPGSKLSLLRSLQISRVFGLVAGDVDSELVSKLGVLLSGFAAEALDCSKRLESEEMKGVSMELLDEVLPSVFYVMQNCELDTTFNIVQFLSGYVSTLRTLSPLKEKQVVHVRQILEVIHAKICYDPVYRDNLSIPDKIGIEEEDRMMEYRKDLFVLLRSVGRVAPDITQMFIRNLLASALVTSSDRNVEEVEAALSLFFALGESLTEEAMRTGNGFLRELLPMLLSATFPCHSNRLVALIYLETITRYVKFIQDNDQCIPLVLAAFLDERGIHHQNFNVSQRASYLFMRVVKLLKAKLVPFIETILQSLQDRVAQFTHLDWKGKDLKGLGSEDGSHIFEAIGLLIGMEDVPLEKQSEYLSSLLIPLCKQVQELLLDAKVQNPEESSAKIANIQQVVMAINALSKGFSERLVTASRPAIGSMFKQTLDVLLQILVVFPKIDPLRSKVTSFIHRMVETLGAAVFPYLPRALEQLLADSEPKEMVGLLVLINQLICKFNILVRDILEEIFPAIASRVFSVLPRDGIPSGLGSNTEEIRELQELQKTLYTFLHVMTTHDLSSVLLSSQSRGYLDPIMQLLLYTSCNHKDITVRKSCVQIFIKLIKDWCTRSHDEEKVPGFRNFIIETFATNCCLYSVLDKSFEFRDANTLVLFGEIVVAQKVMYEKFGNDFIVNFVLKGFPTAHCPQNLAEEYCQKLQGSDIKILKQFYQSLIEDLRRLQNGTFVFR